MTAEGLLDRARRGAAPLFAILLLCLSAAPSHAQFAPPDEPPHYPPERKYDLQHLRLDLAFDLQAGTVAGTATNTLTPLLPGLDTLVFHAAELDIKRVRLADSNQDLPFTADPEARTVTVRLGRTYGPQDRLDVVFEYSAKPRTGLYFVRPDKGYPDKPRQVFSQGEPDLNRHWIPTWDFPNDRATTEMLATVARPYEVIGNGRLLGVQDQPGGRRTFHWKMDDAHTTYLISVVIGEFVRTAETWNGIPVESYVPKELADRARLAFAETPAMLEYFSRITGRPYPYPKYAQSTVYDYMWGGMENITATTLTTRTLRDRRGLLDSNSQGLVSHEVAHQWFGDLITCEDWAHAWLNEGFADYSEVLFRGHANGEDEADLELDTMRDSYLGEAASQYRRPLVTYRYPDPISMFDDHSYEKGALVLHMTRFHMGEEGWWKGVREYVARHAGQSVTTSDLLDAFEEASGASLRPLFDQYVFGAGHPELDLRWSYKPETRMVHLEVHQKQLTSDEIGYFSFPVEIALVGDNGTTLHRVPVEAREVQDLYIPSEQRPRTVVFDPKGWILKTVDFKKPAAEWAVQLDTAQHLAAKLEAVRALGKLGGAEAVAVLAQALREAPFHGVRSAAAEALGEAGGQDAGEALLAGARDKEAKVRTAVFEALGKFPDERDAVPLLRKALETDESYAARAAAAESLAEFRGHRGEVIPALVKALSQASYQELVRSAAIEALADLGAPQAYEQALKLARYGAPPESRDEAVDALLTLASIGDSERKAEIRRQLEGFLQDPNYLFRHHVFTSLAYLGDPKAIPALERSARTEADAMQRLAAEKAIQTLRENAATSSGISDEGDDLRQRILQLEREIEVLKEQLRGLEEGSLKP